MILPLLPGVEQRPQQWYEDTDDSTQNGFRGFYEFCKKPEP